MRKKLVLLALAALTAVLFTGCSRYVSSYRALGLARTGTDGAASSNNLDMLETMKTTALFQKAWRMDPAQMPLGELMDLATVNGAKALGIDTGVLREGAAADLSIVDTESSSFLSPGSFEANLIYSAHSDCIQSVIADGRFVMRNRKVENEESILQNAREALRRIV